MKSKLDIPYREKPDGQRAMQGLDGPAWGGFSAAC